MHCNGAGFSARPLRPRSRHLPPPLALFMVHCEICGHGGDPSISHHESTPQRLRDFQRRVARLCFAKFATHETCPTANELHLKQAHQSERAARSLRCRNRLCPSESEFFLSPLISVPRRGGLRSPDGLSQGEAAAAAGPPGVACPRGVIVKPTDRASGDPASASGHFFPPVASTAAPL